MIREIIRPTTNSYNIFIPEEYINKEVEILVLPFSLSNKDRNSNDNFKTLLASVSEGLSEDDLARQHDLGREAVNWLT